MTNGQLFNQSFLCNEASINPQKERVQRAAELVSAWKFRENDILTEHERFTPFPHILAYASLPSGCV